MASNGNSRGGLLTAGGVLSIVAGAFELIAGGIMLALLMSTVIRGAVLPLLPRLLFPDVEFEIHFIPTGFSIAGMSLLVLGIIAIVGGISAIKRKSFGLSLAGAICALLSVPLGILAVIFVSLGKREFGAERKGNGI